MKTESSHLADGNSWFPGSAAAAPRLQAPAARRNALPARAAAQQDVLAAWFVCRLPALDWPSDLFA